MGHDFVVTQCITKQKSLDVYFNQKRAQLLYTTKHSKFWADHIDFIHQVQILLILNAIFNCGLSLFQQNHFLSINSAITIFFENNHTRCIRMIDVHYFLGVLKDLI